MIPSYVMSAMIDFLHKYIKNNSKFQKIVLFFFSFKLHLFKYKLLNIIILIISDINRFFDVHIVQILKYVV